MTHTSTLPRNYKNISCMMINAFPSKIQRKPENGERKTERKRKEEKKERKEKERKKKVRKKEGGKERGEKGKGGLNVHQPTRPERTPHRSA